MPNRDKAELRRRIRAGRRALDPEERAAWDREVTRMFLSMPEYSRAKTVFCYISYGGEPDTSGITADVLASGRRLVVPRCIGDGIMEAVLISDIGQLTAGYKGILEPRAGLETIGFDRLDIAVVPGLAFDRRGRRLGQGGGFYDRFMAETSAFTCGLCFERFIEDKIPCEPHDIPVMRVVTEKGMFGVRDE